MALNIWVLDGILEVRYVCTNANLTTQHNKHPEKESDWRNVASSLEKMIYNLSLKNKDKSNETGSFCMWDRKETIGGYWK